MVVTCHRRLFSKCQSASTACARCWPLGPEEIRLPLVPVRVCTFRAVAALGQGLAGASQQMPATDLLQPLSDKYAVNSTFGLAAQAFGCCPDCSKR